MRIKSKHGWREISLREASAIFELRGIEVLLNRVRNGCNVHQVENHRQVCQGYQHMLEDGASKNEPRLLEWAIGALRRARDFVKKYPDRMAPLPDEASYPEE